MFQAPLCPSSGAAAARKPDTQPSAPHHTDKLKTKAPNTTGSNHLHNTLELLMMGIMVMVEQAIISAIKKHLLRLVGILFPHANLSFRNTLIYNNWYGIRQLLPHFTAQTNIRSPDAFLQTALNHTL
jgi:hypothetical protein